MKSRFFYGVFAGFIFACLIFFGVIRANAHTHDQAEDRAYAANAYSAPAAAAYQHADYATDYLAYHDDSLAKAEAHSIAGSYQQAAHSGARLDYYQAADNYTDWKAWETWKA